MDKKIIVLVLIPFLCFWHWFDPAAKKNQSGIDAFEAQKYEEALEAFLSAKGLKPDLPQLKSNTAASLYQLKKYKEALEEFSQIDPEETNIPRGDLYYNLGNSFYRLEQYDKALAHFKKSLLENPDDVNTKKNFELTLRKIQEQKQKQEDQKQDQKQDKQQQEEQQQSKRDKEQKHQNVLQYLDQKEKKQLKDKKRAVAVARKEKDW